MLPERITMKEFLPMLSPTVAFVLLTTATCSMIYMYLAQSRRFKAQLKVRLLYLDRIEHSMSRVEPAKDKAQELDHAQLSRLEHLMTTMLGALDKPSSNSHCLSCRRIERLIGQRIDATEMENCNGIDQSQVPASTKVSARAFEPIGHVLRDEGKLHEPSISLENGTSDSPDLSPGPSKQSTVTVDEAHRRLIATSGLCPSRKHSVALDMVSGFARNIDAGFPSRRHDRHKRLSKSLSDVYTKNRIFSWPQPQRWTDEGHASTNMFYTQAMSAGSPAKGHHRSKSNIVCAADLIASSPQRWTERVPISKCHTIDLSQAASINNSYNSPLCVFPRSLSLEVLPSIRELSRELSNLSNSA